MRSAVLQFLVAGALAIAWIWMLGRPLLTLLARRSRRDSIDHFRYQQSMLGRSVDDDFERWERLARFHPLADWRAQPVHRRRLQILLGFALAAFASSLLAIALRGVFVRLFLVMMIAFTAQILVAALIGARELRAAEAEGRRRVVGARAERTVRAETRTASPPAEADALVEDEGLLEGNGIADGLFDDGFFEPIPELERLSEPAAADDGRSIFDPGPAEPEHAEPIDPAADSDETLAARAEHPVDDVADDSADRDPAGPEVAAETSEPTFTTPPPARTRPSRRPKARPIYIESELDDADGGVRAVGD